MKRDKNQANKRFEMWQKENGDKTEHWGYYVTLSVNEGRRVLAKARMRWNNKKNGWNYSRRAEVYYGGKWLNLARTDLVDDVCTFSGDDDAKELDELRQKYMGHIRYGVRVVNGRFSAVDHVSDG